MRFGGPEMERTDTSARPDSDDTYTTHRSLADIRASRTLKGSASNGRAVPFGSVGTSHTSLRDPARTLTRSPWGVQSVGSQYSPGHANSRTTPVPSAAAILSVRLPDRNGRLPCTSARYRPSGDQPGLQSGSTAV